jgi:MFS family permease
MAGIRSAVRQSTVRRVVATVIRNNELRRLQGAYFGFRAAEGGTWLALLVYAYERGGATAAGLLGFALLAPAAVGAPFAAARSDRAGPARALRWGFVAQGAGMAATAAAMFVDAPDAVVYLCAIGVSLSVVVTRPAHSALAPALARSVSELTSANVVTAWIDSLAMFVAPALTGLLLAVADPGAVFAVMAAGAFAAAFVVRGLRGPLPYPATADAGDLFSGFDFIRRARQARILVGLLGAQFIGIGALDVLYVVLALGALGLGASGAGYLGAAFGLGGVLGIGVTAALVGRARLAPALLLGIVAWVAALAVLAAYTTTAAALALLGAAGLARSLVDVAGRTLLQRTAPPELLGRVFGVLEGLSMAGLAVGSLLAPVLVTLVGATGALIAVALVLPVIAIAAGRRILDLDERAIVPIVEISLLRSEPVFAALDSLHLERLARGMTPVALAPGETLMREGDPGDDAFLVAGGTLEVSVKGLVIDTSERGDLVGEIALLQGGVRVATVAARTACELFRLEREAFLDTMSGGRAVTALVAARLENVARAGRDDGGDVAAVSVGGSQER